MKYLIALVILAVVASAEDCSEARADACVDSLLKSLLGDTSEEEVCKELKSSISCLRTAVDECTEGERDDEVEEGLEELGKVFAENCESSKEGQNEEDDSEVGKCLAENEEFVYECIEEGTAEVLAIMMESGQNMNQDAATCSMYALVATCFVDRIKEKCGEEAASLAETEFKDMPEDIKQSCEASEGFIAHTFELLGGEDRKRK